MKLFFFASLALIQLSAAASLKGTSRLEDDAVFQQRRLTTTCAAGSLAVEKTGGAITVDGDTGDWDLTNDFVKQMCEAGNCGKNNAVQSSKLYARYSCGTQTLCLLVLAEPGFYLAPASGGQSWFKNYDIKTSVITAQDPAGVVDVLEAGAGTGVIGWEGCFDQAPSCVASAEIHANFGTSSEAKARTTSTGKPNGDGTISLDLTCGCSSNADCSSNDGCVSATCGMYSNQCETEAISGCECDADDDCSTVETCKVGACSKSDSLDPSTWKCVFSDDTTSPGCTTPTGCTTSQDCFDANPSENTICADATCNAGDCSFSAKSEITGTKCDLEYVATDDCDLGYLCDGKDCVRSFQDDGDKCSSYTLPDGGSTECYTGKCRRVGETTETVCTAETLTDIETKCGDDRGICDQGDWCVAGVCESNHFEPNTKICRPSVGCCDETDTCTGNSFDCDSDGKFGSETVCRAGCDNCIGNPIEVCDGIQDECPEDIILDDELCLFAGQSNPAGTVSVTAKPLPSDPNTYEFCPIISLNGWSLSGNEAIKAEFSTVQTPGSSPGKYSYKYPSGGIVQTQTAGVFGLSQCLDFSASELCGEEPLSLYFAIHLDVTDGQSSETAWAMECPGEGTAHTGRPFMNKKGTAKQGWGQYFVWKPCCPTDPDCTQCSVVPVEPPTTPPPTDNPWICLREFDFVEGNESIISCDEGLVCPSANRRLGFLG